MLSFIFMSFRILGNVKLLNKLMWFMLFIIAYWLADRRCNDILESYSCLKFLLCLKDLVFLFLKMNFSFSLFLILWDYLNWKHNFIWICKFMFCILIHYLSYCSYFQCFFDCLILLLCLLKRFYLLWFLNNFLSFCWRFPICFYLLFFLFLF